MDVFRNPEFPALFTSMSQNPRQLPLSVKLFIGYAHLHMSAFYYMNFAFNMMAVVYYNYRFVDMVSDLKLDGKALKSSGFRLKPTAVKRV